MRAQAHSSRSVESAGVFRANHDRTTVYRITLLRVKDRVRSIRL